MSKSIMEYLPEVDDGKSQLVQMKCPGDLYKLVNEARKADKLTWKDIILAGFKKYLDDRQAKRK